MVLKKVIFLAVLLLYAIPAYAEYVVDETLLYEEESTYLKAEAKLDLLATGRDGFASSEGNDGDDQSLKASVGAVNRVEKVMTGYWADGKVSADHSVNENKTTGQATQRTDSTTFEIRKFEESIFTDQAGLNILTDFADAGHKWYFSSQSPYYGFGQGLVHYKFNRRTGPDENDGLESAIAGGVGYGKIVDLGSYERVLIVQDQLLAAGLINQPFSRSVIRELLPFFRRSMDKTDRLLEIKRILVNNGLVNDKDITLDLANDIQDAIDESFEKREYGFEARGAFLQEITHFDSDEPKKGYVFGYVQYEKPLAENHQFTSQFNFLQQIIGSNDDKILAAYWLNKIASTFGMYIETEAGLILAYVNETDTTTSEKIYGKLTYEITEILSWENSLSLQLTQNGASGVDDTTVYELKSVLTYTIW